jgi:hypothetical protein
LQAGFLRRNRCSVGSLSLFYGFFKKGQLFFIKKSFQKLYSLFIFILLVEMSDRTTMVLYYTFFPRVDFLFSLSLSLLYSRVCVVVSC